MYRCKIAEKTYVTATMQQNTNYLTLLHLSQVQLGQPLTRIDIILVLQSQSDSQAL